MCVEQLILNMLFVKLFCKNPANLETVAATLNFFTNFDLIFKKLKSQTYVTYGRFHKSVSRVVSFEYAVCKNPANLKIVTAERNFLRILIEIYKQLKSRKHVTYSRFHKNACRVISFKYAV